MTPELLLTGLESVLAPKAAEMGVTLSIHGHDDDAFELLANGPEQARLCLTIDDISMAAGAEDQDAGIARITLRALLQAPRDFQLTRQAQEVTGGLNGNVSLLELATWCRMLITRVLWPSNPDFDNVHGIRFLAQRRFAPDSQRGLRSLELRFVTIAGLDMPDQHPLEYTT